MGAERSQWQFPANEVGKVIGWSDEASPSNPSASKGLVNKGPFIGEDGGDQLIFEQAGSPAYIRSFQSKMRDFISPEDFRAVGGDDYSTIMEGLTYLNGQGGGEMRFPASKQSYTLTDKLVLDVASGSSHSTNLKLVGNGCTLTPSADTLECLIEINGSGADVTGFVFDGNLTPSVDAIRNMSIDAPNAIKCRIDANYFVGFAKAFYSEVDQYHFTRNTVRTPALMGIHSQNRGMNSVIAENFIYPLAVGAHGIVIDITDWQAEGLAIRENIVFATGLGGKCLKVMGGLSLHIHGNIFDQGHGIVFDGTSDVIADVIMTGNWIGHHSSYTGADPMYDIVGDVLDFRSFGDTVVSPNGGIRIASAAQNVMFSGPRIRMTSNSSVGVENNSSTTQLLAPYFTRGGGVTTNVDIDGGGVTMLVQGGRTTTPTGMLDDAKVIYDNVVGINYGTTNGDRLVYLGPGTVGAPSMSFREDKDTGIYRVGADVGGLSAGGQLAAQWGTSGISLARTKGLSGDTANVLDDAATSFTPVNLTGILLLSTAEAACEFRFRVGAGAAIAIATANPISFWAATTGVLSGTTGADTAITVSAHTDGKIYIENRRGSTQSIRASVRY